MPQGILILDNNCYAQLEDSRNAAHFASNLRIADLLPQPSEVNLIEATAASPDSVRERLLRTIDRVRDGYPLLPWPFALLKLIGQSILEGRHRFRLESRGIEWYLEDMDAARRLSQEVLAFQRGIEKAFTDFHAKRRQQLHRQLKERRETEDFESSRDFLERVWVGSETRKDFAEVTWNALGLPSPAPVESLEENEAWRLLLDAEGVALYERAIATTQPKMVQRLDLIQLVYLGGAPRRVIASADRGFLRAANNILRGRYSNARAIHIAELISLNSPNER